MNAFSQKVAKVTVSTTDSINTSIQKCIDAGKEAKFGNKDLDLIAGKVTLWKNFFGGNDKELKILITSEIKEGKTLLTLRMPHLPNTMGSYTKDLKKYVDKLKLSDKVVGEYFDGIE
jgi:hypothetical protein